MAVAIATALIVGAGLLLPGVMGLLLVPFALLYVIWAARAALDRRLSIWLSFVSTLIVAIYLGSLGVSMAVYAFAPADQRFRTAPLVAMDAAGNTVELPPDAVGRLRQAQAEADRRARIYASALTLIGFGAWLVIGLYAKEWRWAFTRKAQP